MAREQEQSERDERERRRQQQQRRSRNNVNHDLKELAKLVNSDDEVKEDELESFWR